MIIASIGVVINLAATVIFGIFGCGHGHSHGVGNHGHSHGEEKEKHGHGHKHGKKSENHGHSHENHGHSHENHGHSHENHGHSHDDHGHSHEDHGHSHDHNSHGDSHKKKDSLCKRLSKNVNMCGVFLHFLGDTLTSVVVVVTGALNIAYPESSWVKYVDPVCSLLIVAILIWTSVPLSNIDILIF